MQDFKCACIRIQLILGETDLTKQQTAYRLQAQCFIRRKAREKQVAAGGVMLKPGFAMSTLKLLVH